MSKRSTFLWNIGLRWKAFGLNGSDQAVRDVKKERFDSGVKMTAKNEKELADRLRFLLAGVESEDILFFCIGTDRVTGDSLAPFVGYLLEKQGYPFVIGTIHKPVHAVNIRDRILEIPPGKTVVAIDSALGAYESIGTFTLFKGGLQPGRALGRKDLPIIGDVGLTGIVQVEGTEEWNQEMIKFTRLSLILQMAEKIVAAICLAIPLKEKGEDMIHR